MPLRRTSKFNIVLIIACIALILCMTSLVTMSYLVDTDEAVNTFTVGQVHITLDEADVDEDGRLLTDSEDNPLPRVQGNEYHLIPGQSYIKDPTMTVLAGSEESWVRMTVTLTQASELKKSLGEDFLPEKYVTGWDSAVWRCVSVKADETNDTLTYEFRYKETVKPKTNENLTLEPLFGTFKVPGTLDGDDLKTLNEDGGFKITVMGHAIQKAGFDDEELAWTSFDEQYAREMAGRNAA